MRLMLYIVNSCQQTAKLYKNGGLISGLRILFVRPTVIFAASDAQIADRCGQEREEQFFTFQLKTSRNIDCDWPPGCSERVETVS